MHPYHHLVRAALFFPLFTLIVSCIAPRHGVEVPSPPVGLSLVAGDAQVTISWSPAAKGGAADSYNIYYSTLSSVTKATGTKTAGITATSTTITGLINDKTHYFFVTAVNSAGESDPSAVASVAPIPPPYTPNDPLYQYQWHLKNTGQSSGKPGEDLNVSPAWLLAKGSGVRIAIVDEDMEIAHEDLSANVVAGASYNYCDKGTDPTICPGAATPPSGHGTACAGLAGAAGDNGIGVTGTAMNVKLVGYNMLMKDTAANEADAMTRGQSANDIYSNSWGFPDDTGMFNLSAATWQTAVENGLSGGRGGKGSIYVWAAGNGGQTVDRSDYDGQASYHGVIAVAALDNTGKKTCYSEEGSNLLVSAFGGGQFCGVGRDIATTDMTGKAGFNTNGIGDFTNMNYTYTMNGTSAAAPEVAGIIALMLEANPSLTWRDVRTILATTARKNDPADADWTANGAGLNVNHKYGFGTVDAYSAVYAAKGWTNLPAQKTFTTPNSAGPGAISDGTSSAFGSYGAAATGSITVSGSGISALEFVDVTLVTNHAEPGDLEIKLTSPSGTVSTLSKQHPCLTTALSTVACGKFGASGFRFGVARLLNEPADGAWTLAIRDGLAGNTGNFTSWRLKLYGH